jgi:cell shape-determining protein MreC
MTTISNNRRRKKISPRAAFFLIIIAVVLCAGLLWRDAAANLVWKMLSPVLSMRNEAAVSSTGFFGGFASNVKLAEENRLLHEALASTTSLLVDRNFLYAENLDLKRRLGRTITNPILLAAVLMRPPGIPYGTLMIDVGSRDGVREGDLVSSSGSSYVGRISTVYDTTARVTLFSAPGQTHQGLLRGEVPLTLVGQGSGSMSGEVPVGIGVSVGDPVLLPSITPEFIARVSAVNHPEGQSFQSVYLSIPSNPLELRFVEVHIRGN